LDENDEEKNGYQLFKCLVFDTKLSGESDQTYHLSEGDWYWVEDDYVLGMGNYLDGLWKSTSLPNFQHSNEGKYNDAVEKTHTEQFLCLDGKNIAPSGQSAIEPCDLCSSPNQKATFTHIKRSTFSQQLSHLFNQGLNSAEAIRMLPNSLEKLTSLVNDANESADVSFAVPSSSDRFEVKYAIITHKNPDDKSDNLPFFSRISLMRTLKQLQLMGLDCVYEFIRDKNK